RAPRPGGRRAGGPPRRGRRRSRRGPSREGRRAGGPRPRGRRSGRSSRRGFSSLRRSSERPGVDTQEGAVVVAGVVGFPPLAADEAAGAAVGGAGGLDRVLMIV